MTQSEIKFDNFFNSKFDRLKTSERWKLLSEGQITDAMYSNKQSPVITHRQNQTSIYASDADLRKSQNMVKNEVNLLDKDDKQNNVTTKKIKDNENIHRVYANFQNSVKDLSEKFNKQEDFLRHIDFGTEFDEASKYNSKRKVSDKLGFEYSVPPKEQTIQAKLKGRYNYWVAQEKMLEEDEEITMHELSGSDVPFKIDHLVYDVPYADSESYENYYWKIKDLRHAEQKYRHYVNNIADSALIIDGNVAFGKTVNDDNPDDNPAFERKLSTNSLGDFGANVDFEKPNARKKISSLVKKIRKRRQSTNSDDMFEQIKLINSNSNDNLNKSASDMRHSIKGERLASLRRKLNEGKNMFQRYK